MRKLFLNLFIVLSLLLTGCFGPQGNGGNVEQPVVPTEIIVDCNTIELIVGESAQLNVSVLPEEAVFTLIWDANNDNVSVENGLIKANKAGNSIVTVSCKDTELSQEIVVTVRNRTYSITYELNGGTVEGQLPNLYVEGESEILLPEPTKDGYTFDGWFIGDDKVEIINKEFTGDIHLECKWTEIPVDYTEEVQEIIFLIDALPINIDYSDYNRVHTIKTKYDLLDEESQQDVVNIEILNDKLDELQEIENDIYTITYVLGEDIFTSKIELFNNFFGDFYKFIINSGGQEYLERKNISDLETFLEIASDYNAGRGSMTYIGDIVGSYMLTKDLNGILANQPTDTFFGYCYQNGLYEDLLPFFIRFFAYWRLDERYANKSNYGADTFAESWAPTVDIAKFFHYDSETSYVKTDRMLDCFLNISNVLYGELPTELTNNVELPTDIKLRGYIFEGWYDNPDFTGNPITSVSNEGQKVILYAKWKKDVEQKDYEAAEMVKIYIYNLTTEPANVNRTTVGYVRAMYDELSETAKALVNNYDEFISIEEEVLYLLEEPIVVNVKIEAERDFETLKNEFLNDFNRITDSYVESFSEFKNNCYGLMSEIGLFFKDKGMFIKWAFIIEGFIANNGARGLRIQSNRILNNEGGDLEYVSKAIAYFFNREDASKDGDVSVNFADKNVLDLILNEQDEITVTFTIIQELPVIFMDGYTFDGYYSNGLKINNVEVGMPTELTLKFK